MRIDPESMRHDFGRIRQALPGRCFGDQGLDGIPMRHRVSGLPVRKGIRRMIMAFMAGIGMIGLLWLSLRHNGLWLQFSPPTPFSLSVAAVSTGSQREEAEAIVARIDGEPVYWSEWEQVQKIDQVMSRLASVPPSDPETVLQRLIRQRVVLRIAARERIQIGEEAARERLADLLNAWGVDEKVLEDTLVVSGLSRNDLVEEIRRLLIVERAMQSLSERANMAPEDWLASQLARVQVSIYRIPNNVTVRSDRAAREVSSSESGAPPVGSAVGQQAPDFALQSLDGEILRLSAFRGRPVVLYFWTTWCPVCRQESPKIRDLMLRSSDRDVLVIGVNLREDRETVARYVKSFSLSFPVLLDLNGSAAGMYRITGVPTLLFIDRAGVIRARHVGPVRQEQWNAYLDDIFQSSGDPGGGTRGLAARPAPDFELPREDGSLVRLRDLLGRSSVVLIFYRGPG